MGLKTGLICVGPGQDLTPEAIAEGVYRRPVSLGASRTVDLKFQPEDNRYCGLIADRIVLFDMVAAERAISGRDTAMDDALATWSRTTSVSAFMLHSVVNAYGFALYEAGGCVRRRFGGADTGIARDEGQLTASETRTIKRLVGDGFNEHELTSAWSNADLTANSPLDEFEHSALGEDFVVDLMSDHFGLEPATEGAPRESSGTVRELIVQRPGFLSRLLGRKL